MSEFTFDIKKLILVDSAGFCYIELSIDRHTILWSEGNLGKSSVLNALRLFLLPENSFKNSQKNFAFRDSQKNDYPNDVSYEHYFPSQRSFLILEGSNYIGTYCQILYKTSPSKLSFGRIFVPCAYNDIRPLFWSVGDDDDGIGQAVPELSPQRLIKKLTNEFPKTQVVNESAKLKSILYSNNLMDPNQMRYCVFPLVEVDDARVGSLRTLILLLFDMTTPESIASAVAHIIESSKKSPSDALHFDVNQFISKHDELKKRKQELTQIENRKNAYLKLEKHYQEYLSLTEADYQFLVFRHALKKSSDEKQEKQRDFSKQYQERKSIFQSYEEELSKFSDKQQKNEGKQEIRQKDLEKAETLVGRVDRMLSIEYTGMSLNELKDLFAEKITEKEDQLNSLTNESKREEFLQKLRNKISENERSIKNIEQSLANQNFQVIHQLSERIWQPLAAVNKNLVFSNPSRKLTAEEQQAFEGFSQLFVEKEDAYSLFDKSFCKQNAPDSEGDMKRELTERRNTLKKDHEKLETLKLEINQLNPVERQKQINQLEKELKEIRRNHNDVNEYFSAKINIVRYQQELNELIEKQAELTENINLTRAECVQAQFNLEGAKKDLERIEEELKELLALERECQALTTRFPHLREIETLQLPATEVLVSKNALENIRDQIEEQRNSYRDLLSELKEFIQENIIPDSDHIRSDAPTPEQVQNTFQRLKEVYEELPQNFTILQEQITTHNNSVASHTQVLKDNAEYIKRFQAQINRDFEQVRINDLEGIEVIIDIDSKYRNLVADINRLDPYSDNFLPDHFYERLKVFIAEFHDTKLTMDRIITAINYRTRKNGIWQSKSQSTSTIVLINLELVQIFLQKILYPGCKVTFPLTVDEVLRVDIGQFDWLLPHIKSRGFNLLAASTYSINDELVYKIGQYHEIGNMRTAKPYHPQRNLVYWGGAEYYTKVKNEQMTPITFVSREQLNLPEV